MNTNYIKPEIEVIEMEIEGVIASSIDKDGTTSGAGRSRRQDFGWDEE